MLRHRFATLLTFIATVIATGYLFTVIPKGFFPQQDTGILYGTTEAAQDVSFPEMYRLQEEAGKIVMADPAIDTMAMGLGAGVGNSVGMLGTDATGDGRIEGDCMGIFIAPRLSASLSLNVLLAKAYGSLRLAQYPAGPPQRWCVNCVAPAHRPWRRRPPP